MTCFQHSHERLDPPSAAADRDAVQEVDRLDK